VPEAFVVATTAHELFNAADTAVEVVTRTCVGGWAQVPSPVLCSSV